MSLKLVPFESLDVHGFLFAFHSNYGDILYRLRDIATYWYKVAKFYTLPVFSAPEGVTPSEFREVVLLLVKLERFGYRMV